MDSPTHGLAAIEAVSRAVPSHRIGQTQALGLLRSIWADHPRLLRRLEDLSRSIQVTERYLALPPDAYPGLTTFAERNRAWQRASLELGERALSQALAQAGVEAAEVDHLFFVSTTGISTPTVDVTVAQRLGMRADLKRTPIFGLGCGGGAAALARAADYLKAYPREICVVLAVELCSLTFQQHDFSVANVIASLLFGDGASAVVLAGVERATPRAPRILAAASRLHPGTQHLAGWDVQDSGLCLVLSAEIPDYLRVHLRPDVDDFLAPHALKRWQVSHWAVHTGGPKILRAFEESLELPRSAIERSWRILQHTGNLSSVSVLHALADMLEHAEVTSGEHGVVLAMGPGLSIESLLLRW